MSEETNDNEAKQTESPSKRTTIKDLETRINTLQAEIETLKQSQNIPEVVVQMNSIIDTLDKNDSEMDGMMNGVLQEVSGVKTEMEGMVSSILEDVSGVKTKMEEMARSDSTRQARQRFNVLNQRIGILSSVIVCVLLTNCRGINDIGWENILKRYWRTTGGVVFTEDKRGVKETIDEHDPLDIINKFLELSFGE